MIQEKLNEAVMVMNKSLQVCAVEARGSALSANPAQDVNIQNMNVELVAQMFKNYQSSVLSHLEGMYSWTNNHSRSLTAYLSDGQPQRSNVNIIANYGPEECQHQQHYACWTASIALLNMTITVEESRKTYRHRIDEIPPTTSSWSVGVCAQLLALN